MSSFVSSPCVRRVGLLLIVLGALTGAWVLAVWQWQDPFTALYTLWRQHELSGQYDKRVEAWNARERPAHATVSLAAVRARLAQDAARYRRTSRQGEAIGRIVVSRLGLNMILVDGTDEGSLEKGPGRDLRTFMPGQNRLVYIAGHRTTFLAPFSHIEELRPGDSITLEVPYATIRYSVTGHRIVPADDVSRLRSPRHEEVILQACHPRFFATQRYLVYALPRSLTFEGRSWQWRKLRAVSGGSGRESLQALRRRASASARS
jgi:sortase A